MKITFKPNFVPIEQEHLMLILMRLKQHQALETKIKKITINTF